MKTFGQILDKTTQELSRILPDSGFDSEPKHVTDAAFRRWWLRPSTWKTDVVEIVYRRGGELSLPVNFLIWFPGVTDVSGQPVSFDSTGIETPRIPSVFADLRVHSYARRVASLVSNKLSWFDAFAEPQRCLERVAHEERNGPRGGKHFDQMVNHLRSVQRARQTNG